MSINKKEKFYQNYKDLLLVILCYESFLDLSYIVLEILDNINLLDVKNRNFFYACIQNHIRLFHWINQKDLDIKNIDHWDFIKRIQRLKHTIFSLEKSYYSDKLELQEKIRIIRYSKLIFDITKDLEKQLDELFVYDDILKEQLQKCV